MATVFVNGKLVVARLGGPVGQIATKYLRLCRSMCGKAVLFRKVKKTSAATPPHDSGNENIAQQSLLLSDFGYKRPLASFSNRQN